MITKINQDKILEINGKKTFPQIMYSICSGMYAMGSVCTTNLQRMSVIDADIMGLSPSSLITQYDQSSFPFITMLRKGLQSSPNHFGYMQPDEPIATGQNIAALEQAYQNIKTIDPNHVVIAVDWTRLNLMRNMADIIADDGYTYLNIQWLYDIGYTRATALYFKEVNNTSNYERPLFGVNNFDDIPKPVYAVVQAISKEEYNLLPVTKLELRGLVFLAITMHMRGIIYYTYNEQRVITNPVELYGLVRDPVMVQMYIDQINEIKSLNDILVLPTKDYSWQQRKGTQVSFSTVLTASGNPYIDGFTNFNWILKQDNGIHYLIVLNKDTRPITTTISISGITGTLPITTLGNYPTGSGRAGRILNINNGQFTDSFDGLAVHIYQIGNGIPCPPSQCDFTITQ